MTDTQLNHVQVQPGDVVLSQTEEIRSFVRGSIGHIVLDRPRALNALSHEMCLEIEKALDAWAADDAVEAVVISSSTPRAFCSGGDVRIVRELQSQGEEGFAKADSFFEDEYRMDGKLADFPKPYIAVINGVVMGGGMGVSLHGSHRVITERTFCAMPEMAIGFVTDVGISWAQQRINLTSGPEAGRPSPALALFLGLTGYRFTAADMLWSGLATHLISSDDVDAFVEAIDAVGIDAALEKFAQDPQSAGNSFLSTQLEDIEYLFGEGDWFEIEKRLDSGKADPELISIIDNLLHTANPSSLVATTLVYRANAVAETVQEGIANEFEVGKVLRRQMNFAEGVRAVLVDKDRKPSFDPHLTAEVDPEPYRRALVTAI